jgi:hypothetical protein
VRDQPIIYQPPSLSKSAPKSAAKSRKGNAGVPAQDPSLKRSHDIMEGTTAPTIAERMQHVARAASRLMQTTEAGGGREVLQPHLKGRKSRSGAEMLDNLEDLEEEQEEKEEALRRAMAHAKDPNGRNKNGYGPLDDEDEEIPRGHGKSFMANSYRSIMLVSF